MVDKSPAWVVTDPSFESDKLNKIYRLNTSPWCFYRNFAYDLIAFTKPETILEMGTHFGCSFFAFCQSVKDHKLNTNLIAIDNWEGDEHAGFYGEEVFRTVNDTIKKAFSKLDITLIRSYFEEALPKIENNSVDLLHIDGLHTYDAVKNDFEAALPKLKKDGIMLFHDTAFKDYGSSKFWSEIKKKYPHYEFTFSWGLGVLFPKGDKWYKLMEAQNMKDKIGYYDYKSRFELSHLKVVDLTKLSDERFEAMNSMEKLIKEKIGGMESQAKLVDERGKAIEEQSRMIDERDKIIEAQGKLVREKDEGILAQTKMIDERDAEIKRLRSENNSMSAQLQNLRSRRVVKILRRLKLV